MTNITTDNNHKVTLLFVSISMIWFTRIHVSALAPSTTKILATTTSIDARSSSKRPWSMTRSKPSQHSCPPWMTNHNQNPNCFFVPSSLRLFSFATCKSSLSRLAFSANKDDSDASKPETAAAVAVSNDVRIVHEMPPPLPPQLKHSYYLLRHGQSEGNVEGVISSCRSLKHSSKHGLTPLGYEQGYNSAGSLLDLIQKDQPKDQQGNHPPDRESAQHSSSSRSSSRRRRVFFYSSPFARAKQTAQACIDGLLQSSEKNGEQFQLNKDLIQELNLDIQSEIIFEDGLMERYFGKLDGLPLSTYAYVWPEDQKDVTHTGRFHVESVAAVATRLRDVILGIEQSELHNGDGDIIVLTSHADVLQILQLYASGMENVGEFSSYRFGNGEVRYMGRTTDTLPKPCPLEVPADLPVVN